MPLIVPRSRPWALRLAGWLQGLLTAWQDWAGWRRQAHPGGAVCGLSERALTDIGVPDAWLAAAAHCRARAELERRLLRMGVVPGDGW